MYIYISFLILICIKAYHKYIHIPPTGQYNLRTRNRHEAQKPYIYIEPLSMFWCKWFQMIHFFALSLSLSCVNLYNWMTVDRTNLAVWQLEGCHEGKIWADMPASFRLKGFLVFQDFSVVNMWLYYTKLFVKKKHPRSEMIWVSGFVEKPCGLWFSHWLQKLQVGEMRPWHVVESISFRRSSKILGNVCGWNRGGYGWNRENGEMPHVRTWFWMIWDAYLTK